MSLRVCFVCQSGALEDKAILLAASLRGQFPDDAQLTACHPDRHGPLRKDTERAFESLRVRVQAISNPLRESYPIGHKLAALSVLEGSGHGLFLDTDILAMSPPAPLPEGLAAVPATRHHCDEPAWRYLYDAFGLTFPAEAPATLESNEQIAPYFNSGVIAVPGPLAKALTTAWIETAQRIDNDPRVPDAMKDPWLDQVAFPIAAARLGQSVSALDARWNFPSWCWKIGDRPLPIFFHYRKFARLRREKPAWDAAGRAAAPFPELQKQLSRTLRDRLFVW